MSFESPRGIIYDWFYNDGNEDICSLINYLSEDEVVAWFVDEGFVENLDYDEQEIINSHYELHCM